MISIYLSELIDLYKQTYITCLLLIRYLVKSYKQARAGQQLTGIVSYLNEPQNRIQPHSVSSRPTVVSINDLACLVEAYKFRAAK